MSDIVSAALAKEAIDDATPASDENSVQKIPITTENPTTQTDTNTPVNEASAEDAENQVAAVLTEMQNANNESSVPPSDETVEGNQENSEPSIAVIMQDDGAAQSTEQAVNTAPQVQLTQDQLEVMQSGQIPNQASMYTLGNIVLILSPEVMAAGGLTQEQLQQIQESQANALDGSGANLNLQGLQSTTIPNAPDVANILQQVPATTVAAKQSSPAKKPEKEQDKGQTVAAKDNKDSNDSSTGAKDNAGPTSSEAMDTSEPAIASKGFLTSPEKKKVTTYRITKKKANQQENKEKDKTPFAAGEEEKASEKHQAEQDKNTEKDMQRDIIKELEKRPFKCAHCEDTFATEKDVENHTSTHSNRRKRESQPDDQEGTPEAENKSGRPKRNKTSKPDVESPDESLQCEVCGDIFTAEVKLRKHLTTHNVNKRLHCDGCKVPFAFQYQLDRHIRRNTGNQPYKCDQCEDSFPLRCHFNYHLRLHNPKKSHSCEKCGKLFNSLANLKGHIRTHTGEKPFKCETCEKCFSEYSSLAKHKRSHTGERPFKCPHCTSCFTQSGGLKAHLMTHTGERPFKCSSCEKAFAKKYNLHTHMRIHSGEKPYRCDICGMLFTQHSTLAQHVRRHENKAPKMKVTTGQQTTGNPEMDIVESHPVATSTSSAQTEPQPEQQEAGQVAAATNGAPAEAPVEHQPVEVPKTTVVETVLQAAIAQAAIAQSESPIIVAETVLNEKSEAEQMADIQEASQAIQMLQMQQLVNQVEEVVAAQANAGSYSTSS